MYSTFGAFHTPFIKFRHGKKKESWTMALHVLLPTVVMSFVGPMRPITSHVHVVRAPAPNSLFFPNPNVDNDIGIEGTCALPIYLDEDEFNSVDPTARERFRIALSIVPFLCPIAAFFSYDFVVHCFHELVTASRPWFSVDGGSAETLLITPVINGIVLPSTSVVLGTLMASTLTSLRQRQINIRACLNKEACDIRTMDSVVNALYAQPADAARRRTLLNMVHQYVSRIIVESRAESTGDISKTSESELDGLMRAIYDERKDAHWHSQGDGTPEGGSAFSGAMKFSLPALLQSLNHKRSQRLAELQTSYPAVHWLILSLLGSSIIACFLIESDSAALQFLDSLRLRLLFSSLMGVASATVTLCIDLNDPFRGNFCITPSADQLYVIRESLAEQVARSESQAASASGVGYLQGAVVPASAETSSL